MITLEQAIKEAVKTPELIEQNELAQIKMAIDILGDEVVDEVAERVAYVMFGKLHPKNLRK